MGIPPLAFEEFIISLFYCLYTYQNKGKYEVMTGIHKNTAEMLDLYVDLINKFPSIIALIDPFRKEVMGLNLNFLSTESKNLILLG